MTAAVECLQHTMMRGSTMDMESRWASPKPVSDGAGADMWGSGERPRRRTPWWAWVLMGLGGVVVFSCACCGGGFVWFAANTPDTQACSGSELPSKYRKAAEDLGAIDPGEQVLWFYSDDLVGVRDMFYLVSDQRVAVYRADAQPQCTRDGFDQIAEVELLRDTSFFTDSQVTLTLHDGSVVSFPVSSELDRDVRFFEAITMRAPEAAAVQR